MLKGSQVPPLPVYTFFSHTVWIFFSFHKAARKQFIYHVSLRLIRCWPGIHRNSSAVDPCNWSFLGCNGLILLTPLTGFWPWHVPAVAVTEHLLRTTEHTVILSFPSDLECKLYLPEQAVCMHRACSWQKWYVPGWQHIMRRLGGLYNITAAPYFARKGQVVHFWKQLKRS